MKEIVAVVQIIFAALLVVVILLQAKGSGLGQAWGGSGEFYRSKRGVEKILFKITIALSILFFIWSIVSVSL